MKLWKISQTVFKGFDTYDAAVVASKTKEGAIVMHPIGKKINIPCINGELDFENVDEWTNDPRDVVCKYLGVAAPE